MLSTALMGGFLWWITGSAIVAGAVLITLLREVLQNVLPRLLGENTNYEIVVLGVLMIFG